MRRVEKTCPHGRAFMATPLVGRVACSCCGHAASSLTNPPACGVCEAVVIGTPRRARPLDEVLDGTVRCLRVTLYGLTPDEEMTTFMRESDLRDDVNIEDAAPKMEGAFVMAEVLNVPARIASDMTALAVFVTRHVAARAEGERAMAIGFYWNVEQLSTRVRPGGVLVNPRPCPFGVEDVKRVLSAIFQSGAWDNHTVIMVADDFTIVELCANGNIRGNGSAR
jgi:hypothetical protein